MEKKITRRKKEGETYLQNHTGKKYKTTITTYAYYILIKESKPQYVEMKSPG